MAKYYGAIGYNLGTIESAPGVWKENVIEQSYSGDIIKNTSRWQSSENLNDDLTISNVISIVADQFAFQNFGKMRYIVWMGSYWKITNAEVQRPRLILTIGGEYNGEKATTTSNTRNPST